MSSCRLKKQFFPTLTCGVFVFSAVSAPSSFLPPACPPILPHTISSSITSKYITHTHTSHTQYHEASHPIHHSHTHVITHTHTHTRHHSHTHHSHTHIPHTISSSITSNTSLSHTHTHPTHNIIKHHIQYITHTHTSFSHTRHSGSEVSLWRSLVSAALPVAFAWQAWDLVHCKGVGCTPRCPSGVHPVSLGLRRSASGFCVAGVGLGALQRGRMYAPDPGLNFYYGVENPFCTKASKFLTSAIIKWWFSTPRGLRKMTTWYCYKMIGFYHEVTWRGNSTTTKWRLVFIIKLLEGDTPPLQNEDLFLYAFIIRLLEGKTSILQNDDWKWLESICVSLLAQHVPTCSHHLLHITRLIFFGNVNMLVVVWRATRFATKWDWVFTCCLPKGNLPCYNMRLGFYMLSSDGQVPLLQNDFRFLNFFQLPKRWRRIKCNSQALGTKCLAHPHFFMLI